MPLVNSLIQHLGKYIIIPLVRDGPVYIYRYVVIRSIQMSHY